MAKMEITEAQAMELINNGYPLKNIQIKEKLRIHADTDFNKEISIEQCVINELDGSFISYEKPIKIVNSHLGSLKLSACFFSKGLTIENCTFSSYVDFSCGGHNEIGYSIIIRNNVFNDFVDFFDCIFHGEVIIAKNKFLGDTNLENKRMLLSFDTKPIIEENIGIMDIYS